MSAAHDDRGWRGVIDHDPPRTLFDAAAEADLVEDSTIEGRFLAFHAAHPEVYVKLRQFALELVAAGWDHFGVSVPWERVRYETMLGAHRGEDTYKLNDHYRSRYARLLIDQEPELADVFTVRALRSARPPTARRLAGECSACAAGHCRSCHAGTCGHACEVAS